MRLLGLWIGLLLAVGCSTEDILVDDTENEAGGDGDADGDADADADADTDADADAEVNYTLDDGSIEGSIGHDEARDIWWANQFDAEIGGERIIRVQITFGGATGPVGVTLGDPFTIYVYEDPNDDGDPADLEILSSQSATVALSPGSGLFEEIVLSQPATVSGTFFVACLLTTDEAMTPLALDYTSAKGQSWLAHSNTQNTLDPSDVAGTSSIGPVTIEDAGYSGNFLIRAVGTSP